MVGVVIAGHSCCQSLRAAYDFIGTNGATPFVILETNDFMLSEEVVHKPAMELDAVCRRQADQKGDVNRTRSLLHILIFRLIGDGEQGQDVKRPSLALSRM